MSLPDNPLAKRALTNRTTAFASSVFRLELPSPELSSLPSEQSRKRRGWAGRGHAILKPTTRLGGSLVGQEGGRAYPSGAGRSAGRGKEWMSPP